MSKVSYEIQNTKTSPEKELWCNVLLQIVKDLKYTGKDSVILFEQKRIVGLIGNYPQRWLKDICSYADKDCELYWRKFKDIIDEKFPPNSEGVK